MCGIAGILTPRPLNALERSALAAMRVALRHRGPDGEGEWLSPDGHTGLAHTRLAVFDPTKAGHQPMSIEDGRFTIVYNGAIYNFTEIRRSLEQAGISFTTTSDTEVILRLYERDGQAGLARLRGMFAFALWDAATGACLLARDRFGIKPLYYAVQDGRLVFASEIRAMLASGLVDDELDAAGVYGFFRTGSVPEPHTLVGAIKCVPAGHALTWVNGRMSARQYWCLRFTGDGPVASAVADTRRVLADSVASHFAGDVPVGLFLSGGLDSSAILALSHVAGRRGVPTFSLSLPSTADDEGPLARRTAEHFGAHHHVCEMDATATRAAFASYVAAVDQPSVDGLNSFVMARFAHEHGAKVVLSGLGADELFGGYPTFAGVPRLAAWHRRLDWTGAIGAGFGRLAEAAAFDPRSRRVADMFRRAPSLDNAYQTYRGIFTHAEASRLTTHFLGRPAELPEPDDAPLTDAPGDAVSRFELTRYVRNQLLRDSDVMSMAWGVELRTPFLDAAVVDCLAQLPGTVRLSAGKALLRSAVPEVPAWVTGQPKRCFQFPFARWIDGEWQGALASADRACPVSTDTWYRKWCVFAVESWMMKSRAAHV